MDTTLKKRLVGAMVLIALAVIFLPPLLTRKTASEPGVSTVPTSAPSRPGTDYQTRELPLVTVGPAAEGDIGSTSTEPPSLPPPPASTETTMAVGAVLPPTTAGGDYAVNFGAYATADDAQTVVTRLRQEGLPGYREQDTVNGRSAWRVRIGPYANRAQAETVRLEAVKIRSDVSVQVVALNASSAPAAVRPPVTATPAPTTQRTTAVSPPQTAAAPVATASLSPPVAAAPATTAVASTPAPAASATGFVVQLGAFASATDANALRDKARTAGFTAFVEPVRTDNGTLNRVRVGPVPSRTEAESMKASVAAKMGTDGMVLPHP